MARRVAEAEAAAEEPGIERPRPLAGAAHRRGYPAWLYYPVHDGNPGDVDFYRRACAGAGPVLELGCGTGRIGGALVADGLEVVGVDCDADALEAAAAAGIETHRADLRRFELGRTFPRIVAAYNTLYCLAGATALVAALRNARRHLAPDGLLVFDVYCADAFHADEAASRDAADATGEVGRFEIAGRTWQIHERSRWDRGRQRIDAIYRHVPDDGGDPIDARISHRYFTSDQLPALLARAGLSLASLHGDFDESPFGAGSPYLVGRAVAG